MTAPSFVALVRGLRGAAYTALVVLASGCGASSVTRGADLYAQQDYVGAEEMFEHAEPRLRSASLSDRARYGLYRAATLLTLGDVGRAQAWLGYTVDVVQENPSVLSEEERVMLERALTVRSTLTVRSGPAARDRPSVALR